MKLTSHGLWKPQKFELWYYILYVDAKALDTGNNANKDDRKRFSSKTKFIGGVLVLFIVCAIVVIATVEVLMSNDRKGGKGTYKKADSGENKFV